MGRRSFRRLSSDNFERLIYWLVRGQGDFDAVQWYGSARGRDTGRDVVAHKHTDTGRERWYIQCKQHTRVKYATLREELDRLAKHAAESPGFAPHVVVFATACDIPSRAKDKATIYARALGLPAPSYWDRRELDEMLAAQPETEEEFFGRQGYLQLQTYLTNPVGWGVTILLGTVLFLVVRVILGLGLPASNVTMPTATPAFTQEVTPVPASIVTSTPNPTSTPAPTPTVTPSPTDTPMPTFTIAPSPSPTPSPTSTPTPTTVPPLKPVLLDPLPGASARAAIFRWEGELGFGQFFIVHLQHLASGQTWRSRALTTTCWDAVLPAELFGGWRWQVQVVQENVTLAQSEEWDFWFDPFPLTPLPPPRPCGE
ncbi:MAG: restriction endonuclease [Chloroflexota bacterium]|nr:restriction endonuclease [Chloroflexota bacterium]